MENSERALPSARAASLRPQPPAASSQSGIANAWQPIESAPTDGTVFLAVNHDGELYPTKYIDGRIVYRMNGRYEPRKFTIVYVDGEKLLREDEQYAADGECWRSVWTYWSRKYDFAPTFWMPITRPPAQGMLLCENSLSEVEAVGQQPGREARRPNSISGDHHD